MALDHAFIRALAQPSPAKILCLLLDGLGGLGDAAHDFRTELEVAHTPNLDALAPASAQGLADPVGPGITPGSGPGHLGLFGYDPTEVIVGRGVLAALGVDFPLEPGDIAARVNLASLDAGGKVSDRRAGRIACAPARALCERLEPALQAVDPNVPVFVRHVREHRGVLIVRLPGGSAAIADGDPQRTGVPPLALRALAPEAQATAAFVERLLARARELLRDEPLVNALLPRGFASLPEIDRFGTWTGMRARAFAAYPMYRGLARLIGMEVERPYDDLTDALALLAEHWDALDFAFVHYKPTDARGEDGDFEAKVAAIEAVDARLPEFLALNPGVVIVTGDHSTPATMAGHSWHPVPVMLWGERVRRDGLPRFTESHARQGGLGRLPMRYVLLEAMAAAGKLAKFGA